MSTPNAPRPALTPRQRFLRERQQRQNTTFAVIGIAMIVAAVAAALVFTGIVPVPFGNDFSVKVKYAETGDIPCPTVDAKPVAPSQVTQAVSPASSASESEPAQTAAPAQPAPAQPAPEGRDDAPASSPEGDQTEASDQRS